MTNSRDTLVHALHHIAWEGVQLLRAHEFARSASDDSLAGLVATAAAIHTRSLGHFLFSRRDNGQDHVHADDILAEDLGAESVGRLESWQALRTACNKEVAHLTWERVRRRAKETKELTKWARSDDVGALLLQLVNVVSAIRDRLGSEYRAVARDGTDYVQELLDGYARI